MKEKTFLRILGVWTALVVVTNLIYIPYLIKTTSGGEQAPMMFIAKSLIVWLFIGGLLLGVHRLTERR
jgi:hypothetical protein